MALQAIKGETWEDSGATLMARVVGNAATAITQASLTSVHYTVYDISDPTTAVQASTSLTVSAVVFDTYQTDARWTKDATGYNFRHTVAASLLSGSEKVYRVEYKFTPTSGEVFYAVFEVTTRAIYGS